MESLSCILLLFSCTIIVYSLVARLTKPNHNLPPGPYPLPIIGNLLDLGKKPHQSMANLAMIHGPVMKLKLGQVTTIVISSVEAAKEVLQTHDESFPNRPIPQSVAVVGHEPYSLVFMPISPLWRDFRKICNNELLSQKTLDASKELRRKIVQQLINDIYQSSQIGEAVDIFSAAFKTTINLLSNTVFSMDMVDPTSTTCEFMDVVTNIIKLVGTPNLADYFPVLKLLDLQRIRKHQTTYVQKLLSKFEDLVNQRMKLRASNGFDSNNDMLAALLNISQENKSMNKTVIEHLFHVISSPFIYYNNSFYSKSFCT